MKRKKQPKYYIQGWGTYSNETLVCVGMTFDEILAAQKKEKAYPWIKKVMLLDKHLIVEQLNAGNAFVWHNDGTTLLYFPEWKNNWNHWDTLIHEISHLIDFVMVGGKRMSDETEGKAYQMEYLFREIRRKLWKLYP